MKKVGYLVLGFSIFSLLLSSFAILGVFSSDSFAQIQTWERVDLLCPGEIYEKTLCYSGGLEQCKVKECPPPF
jgi:hypothetical protein